VKKLQPELRIRESCGFALSASQRQSRKKPAKPNEPTDGSLALQTK
jgi:hypothetical protein